MRLWSIWNVISSAIYFVGVFVSVIAVSCVLWYAWQYAAFWVALLIACVLLGIALGIVGNIGRVRQTRRSRHIDAELAEIVKDGQKTPK